MARGGVPRSLALVLAVLLAVPLAGCAGLVADDSPTEETVTPAPVPTETAALPPGVSAAGVSAEALASAHERRLRTTNYTLVSRQRIVGEDGTLRTTNRTRAVSAGGETYAGRFDRTVIDFPLRTLPMTIEYWTNESVYASRQLLSGSATVYGWSRDGGHSEDVDESGVVARVLRAVDTSVVKRERGVVVVGSDLRRPETLPHPPYLDGPHNVSLTATVDSDGVVTRWRLAYDARIENRTVRVVRETRITDIGTTTVDRPDWVSTAREWVTENRAR